MTRTNNARNLAAIGMRPLTVVCVAAALAACAPMRASGDGGRDRVISTRGAGATYQDGSDGRGVREGTALEQAGRISLIEGQASYFSESLRDARWISARMNMPVVSRSSLATDASSRAEVRIGRSAVHLDRSTQADFGEVGAGRLVIGVARGSVSAWLPEDPSGSDIELVAGEARALLRQAGRYSLDTDDNGDMVLRVHEGSAELRSGNAGTTVGAGQQIRFRSGASLGLSRGRLRGNAFEGWVQARVDRIAQEFDRVGSESAYLSPEVTGAEVLASQGVWTTSTVYGSVWYPNTVAVGWSPYSSGYWTEYDPWGRVWIDDAPWGFTTSHYGRWHRIDGRWGWVPYAHVPAPVFGGVYYGRPSSLPDRYWYRPTAPRPIPGYGSYGGYGNYGSQYGTYPSPSPGAYPLPGSRPVPGSYPGGYPGNVPGAYTGGGTGGGSTGGPPQRPYRPYPGGQGQGGQFQDGQMQDGAFPGQPGRPPSTPIPPPASTPWPRPGPGTPGQVIDTRQPFEPGRRVIRPLEPGPTMSPPPTPTRIAPPGMQTPSIQPPAVQPPVIQPPVIQQPLPRPAMPQAPMGQPPSIRPLPPGPSSMPAAPISPPGGVRMRAPEPPMRGLQ